MRKSLLASVLLLSCASQIVGQSSTGSIVGTVVDAQGLPIKDATVTLTNLGTNSSYGSSTGTNGGYQFESMDYGYYRVSVTRAGFKAGVVNNIKLIPEHAFDFSPTVPFTSQAHEFTVVNQNSADENGGSA